MKVIYNKYIPTKNFTAINLFGVVFARKEHKSLKDWELNHERIHSRQIAEFLGPVYYIVYVSEWIVRLLQYKDRIRAYRNISFEREAYDNQYNLDYPNQRKAFAFIHYYKQKEK